MATPHNQAEKGEIARTVLMPGDPLRAKFIAETYLENVKVFNSVRNMLGFTGRYKEKEVSVMGSGMGMPSIGIYSYELYTKYDVENIIRIGSAGSYCDELKVLDLDTNQALIIAMVCGILVTCLMNLKRARLLLPAVNGGAESSLPAIMNTACAVGFGSVVKMTVGFALLKTMP